ncbi:MAG: alpha/beta hydrolase [Gemmatimonadetes bacterium]|nr:alpha/beta hydrolase [Gemmatimonadota bacterium]
MRLHLFFPPGHQNGNPQPALVLFFGGGWYGGEPGQFYPQARYFASRGLVAIAAEYRTSNTHGTSPFESVRDARSAMRWVRTHAAELGVDPQRIAAGGGSAGGHLAAAAALLPGIDEAGEDLSVSSRPDALVLFNPVIDNGPGGYGYERIGERYPEFSPLHNVAPSAPPTIVFLGTEDNAVPVQTIRRFEERMRGAGARVEVRLYEGQKHGFFNYGNGENEYYFRTVREADRFLSSLGYLQGHPTL